MIKKSVYNKKKHAITPDKLRLPEWGVYLHYANVTSVNLAFSFIDNTLYLEQTIHPNLYSTNNLTHKAFDGRIYTDSKIFSFWQEDNNDFFNLIIKISEKLKNHDYITTCDPNIIGTINLEEYSFIFTQKENGKIYVVNADFDGIKQLANTDNVLLFDTSYLRSFHLSSPLLKKELITHEVRNANYLADCKYWQKRIGSMDVAEWHLLMYEE